MSDTLHADLSVALATRLGLQISLSSLAIVEEWMDPKLDRWLESVPMPPEVPRGGRVRFVVAVGSDLGRLRWAAFGHPGGFIPKLADYLSKCGVSTQEVALINALGERFDPREVGSFIEVVPGTVRTGWQFLDTLPMHEVASLAGDDASALAAWCAGRGIERCVRLSRCISDRAYLETEVELSAGSAAELAATAADAFATFGLGPIGDVAHTLASAEPTLSLIVRSSGGAVTRASLRGAGLHRGVVPRLCSEVGAPFDAQLDRLQDALAAEEAQSVEYVRERSGDTVGTVVDVHYVPGAPDRARPN